MNTLNRSILAFALVMAGSLGWAADSGFLTDYLLLEDRPGNVVSRVHIAPGALEALAGYSSVMIDQPEVLVAPDSRYKGAKPDHLKVLADTLRQTMVERFDRGGYTVVDRPGPGVVYVHWAITDLYLQKKKRGVLSYTPVGFVVHSTKQAAIRDVWRKIDIVELSVEAEFVDGVSQALLAAAVMERGARKDKATGQEQQLVSWEELDFAMQTFAERLRCNLDNARKLESARYDCATIALRSN